MPVAHPEQMQPMTLRVTNYAVGGPGEDVTATVVAVSKERLGGRPVVAMDIHLRLPAGSTVEEAYDLALAYLDVE